MLSRRVFNKNILLGFIGSFYPKNLNLKATDDKHSVFAAFFVTKFNTSEKLSKETFESRKSSYFKEEDFQKIYSAFKSSKKILDNRFSFDGLSCTSIFFFSDRSALDQWCHEMTKLTVIDKSMLDLGYTDEYFGQYVSRNYLNLETDQLITRTLNTREKLIL